ncbi:MAG: hypothetical protein WCX63_05370 [Methanoregula sp.]
MDTTITDDIWHCLNRYGNTVQETRDHAAERSSFGRYRAGAPYFEQYPLRRVLASVQEDAVFTGALAEYKRITCEFQAVERAGGRKYREELFHDLFAYTEAYRTLLCYHELGMHGAEGIADLRIRDEIGVLLLELRKDFSLAEIEQEVTLLDDTIKNIREAERTVQPVQELPQGSTGMSDPRWQQYPSSPKKQEQAGFR